MKGKLIFSCLLIACLAVLGGCMERDLYKGVEKPSNKEFNDFDFSTVASATSLEVDYLDCGVQAAVYFELYDEMPVTRSEYGFNKRTDVTPLFAAYTDKLGSFRGALDLPAYLDKVYIYTPAFYARTLIEAKRENGAIRATDMTEEAGEADTRVTSTGRTAYHSYVDEAYATSRDTPSAYQNDKWKTWLGTYDQYRNGEVSYKYTGEELKLANVGDLYTAHTQVIPTDGDCPETYRCYADMSVNKAAEVAVTFLGQNTCWNCSLGYYYYEEGKAPTSLAEANVIMLFPNTQDGKWSRNTQAANKTAGIDRGTAVQLKYYPNIASGDKTGETTTFPAGTRIGFVLANNAWSNRITGYTDNKKYRAATSKGLSVDNNGTPYGEARTAVYQYGDQIMISFEDHTDDSNFSDVVIAMKSNPVDAITDVPVVDPGNNRTTATVLKGIYAFEDMWPEQGDYDMNDVLVRLDYTSTFNTQNEIYSEAFTLKTFQNYASLPNGLAFKLETDITPTSWQYEQRPNGAADFTAANFTREGNICLLTEDVRSEMGTEYRVSLNHEKSPIGKASEIEPFIYRSEEGGTRWEVHLPGTAPTAKMNQVYFGEGDDASNPLQGIYYVRNGNYPFAFFLSGANENNLSKLLDRSNEAKSIDQLYPGYNTWVDSNGTSATDWYK